MVKANVEACGADNNAYWKWPRWAPRFQKDEWIVLLELSEKEVVYLVPAYGGRRSTSVQLFGMSIL